MSITQNHAEWNILKGAETAGTLQQWTHGMSDLLTKAMQQIAGLSKAAVSLFSHRRNVSSLHVTWAGVLRSDSDHLVPESSEELRFQVANQMFLCEEGKRLVFDDTWNQDAWHDTTGYRVVFKTDSAEAAKRPWHRLQHWFTNFAKH